MRWNLILISQFKRHSSPDISYVLKMYDFQRLAEPTKAATPDWKKFEEKRAAKTGFRDIFGSRLVVKTERRVFGASVIAQSL